MKLTPQQLEIFYREGWVFIPDAFSAEEVTLMRDAAADVFRTSRPEIWLEKSGAPRTAFACHTYNECFRILANDHRLVEPLEQIFGEQCYMHQFKINAKSSFSGDVWQWHQDFPTWHKDDGMPEPRAMNISVFLDDVLPVNGPLMLVPRSHVSGAIDTEHDTTTTAYPLWTLDNKKVAELVEQGGIVAPTGKAGGLLLFHANLVHGSAGNITPYPRKIVYLTLNALSNQIRTPTRPEFIAHTDFTPVSAMPAGALAEYARAQAKGAAA
ncbi:MAG: phytanoyl-CoA dioxygenase family protein [Xanthobacter sp.]